MEVCGVKYKIKCHFHIFIIKIFFWDLFLLFANCYWMFSSDVK